MARGILRVYLNNKPILDRRLKNVTVLENIAKRHFSRSGRCCKQAAKDGEVKGVPYSKLTIGVPKEIWQNEKR